MSESSAAQRHGSGVFDAPRATGAIRSVVALPGENLSAVCELAVSALADGASRLSFVPKSKEVEAVVETLRCLGCAVSISAGDSEENWEAVVTPGRFSGSTRLRKDLATGPSWSLVPLAGLYAGEVVVEPSVGDSHTHVTALITALRGVGVDVDDRGTWDFPLALNGHGRIRGGRVVLDSATDLNLAVGLLLAASRFDVGLDLVWTAASRRDLQRIDLVIDLLGRRGVRVQRPAPGEWFVESGSPRSRDVEVEPDIALAAPFLALGLVAGGQITVPRWPLHSTQSAAVLPSVLQKMGASASRHGGNLIVRGGAEVNGFDVDLSAAPDLVATVMVLGAVADSPSRISGCLAFDDVARETVDLVASNLRQFGAGVDVANGVVAITPATLKAGVWQAGGSAVVAFAGALLGARLSGVRIAGVEDESGVREALALWADTLAEPQ